MLQAGNMILQKKETNDMNPMIMPAYIMDVVLRI